MGSLFDLRGATALVTGAAGGLGQAIAQALADQGAELRISDLSSTRCELVAHGLRERGANVTTLACDLSRRDEVEELARTAEALGAIDILVCTAGIAGPSGPLSATTDAAWEELMTVNLRSALWLCTQLIPGMARRGRGSVILDVEHRRPQR